MIEVSREMIIRCCTGFRTDPDTKSHEGKAEVYFAETRDLALYYPMFQKWASEMEKTRAGKFISEIERETYITCHGFLRIILARKINTDPYKISYSRGAYNKPGLAGDPLFFNISHSKKAFAIAISENYPIGLDIEDMDRRVDMTSVSRNYFSRLESEFIMKSGEDQKERFFLVWTRKEALLKAMGTGIIDDLNKIEVSESENSLDAGLFNKNYCHSQVSNHFLYSEKIAGHFMSLAMPADQLIDFTHLDSENIKSLLVQF
jgi:4'-phosphopantetheinyl transferase